jgi:hypothetical protein
VKEQDGMRFEVETNMRYGLIRIQKINDQSHKFEVFIGLIMKIESIDMIEFGHLIQEI